MNIYISLRRSALDSVLFGKIGAGVALTFRKLVGAPMPRQHDTQVYYTVPVHMYQVLQIYMQSMYGSNEAEVLIVYLKY